MSDKDIDDAIRDLEDEAAADAYDYLEKVKPRSLQAIQRFVSKGKSTDWIISRINRTYDVTEEKTRHKMTLVVRALVRERERG